MGDTKIEWTDKTWNPIRGCTDVGPECTNCYAKAVGARFSKPGQAYEGLARFSGNRRLPQWTNVVRPIPKHADDPLHWKDGRRTKLRRPLRIFVNSMSDLFHEGLTNEQIGEVFHVMTGEASASAPPKHTYQILTKRADRMRAWVEWVTQRDDEDCEWLAALGALYRLNGPPPDVWLGVSVGIRSTLHRLDDLRATPAAVRFVSFEPLLEDVGTIDLRGIDWAIIGGESGARARPTDVAWIRRIVAQCVTAGVKVFVKQLGKHPYHIEPDPPGINTACSDIRLNPRVRWWKLKSKKGGDMQEWPHDLRLRQFPVTR